LIGLFRFIFFIIITSAKEVMFHVCLFVCRFTCLLATSRKKMLSYRRQTALQGALYFSLKVEDWNWETIFYGHYRSIFNHRDIILLKICRIRRKNSKWRLLRRSRSFKVIEVGTNRKPVCNFLLVINSNFHPISYRFRVIAAYCSNFGHFAFLSHPLGAYGQRTMFILGSLESA